MASNLKICIRFVLSAVCRFADNNRKLTFGLKSAFLGWTTVVLGYTNLNLTPALWKQPEIKNYLANHGYLVFLLLSWPIIISFFFSWISDLFDAYRSFRDMKSEAWHTFVKMLNDVVGEKTKRFGEFARNMPQGIKRAEAFIKITQPYSQIEHLVRNLRNVLVLLTKDNSLRVVLAPIEKNIPQPNPIFEPKDIVPPLNLFSCDAKKTLFYKCAIEKKTIVISDIAKELKRARSKKRYVESTIQSDNYGSILCHPLIHPYWNRVFFCLTVKSDSRGTISDDFKEKYLFMIDSFSERILLEASLDIIKKGASE